MKWLDNISLALVIIGAVNWLLVGIFRFDLVAFLFGNLTWLSRIIYTLVGLCGLYAISFFGRIRNASDGQRLMKTRCPIKYTRGVSWYTVPDAPPYQAPGAFLFIHPIRHPRFPGTGSGRSWLSYPGREAACPPLP